MTRAIDSAGLFQSYIALGLEPGTPWDLVQQRYKDLIMAWHPDRFLEEKQKLRAEEELKKINAARDKLRRHFRREHSKSPTCACRAQMFNAAENPPDRGNQPESPAGTAVSRLTPAWVGKNAPIFALCILSLGSLFLLPRILHGVSAGRPASSPFRAAGPAPDPARPVASTPDPGPQQSVNPIPEPEPIEKDNKSTNAQPRQPTAVPGTFYAGFVRRHKDLETQEIESRRAGLEQSIAQTKQLVEATGGKIALMDKQLVNIDKELEEHQSIISETERVESELQGPSNPAFGPPSIQLYLTNPSYKQHADAANSLVQKKQFLQAAYVQESQKLMQEKAVLSGLKTELAGTGRP